MSRIDPERELVWRQLLVAHAAIERMLTAALQAERGVSLSWYDVLAALQQAGGTLRVMELAETVMSNPSSLSRQLDRMEEAHLVRRDRHHDDDARAVVVALTSTGRATWRGARTTYPRVVRNAFTKHLTESDVVALGRVFTKVLGAD